MAVETTTEFAVNFKCGKCVKLTEDILNQSSGISKYEIDFEKQSVVVTSSKSISEVKKLIESTGKQAVVLGTGASKMTEDKKSNVSTAVAMLGGIIGAGKKKVEGVIRFVQVDEENCVIDGTIDGLNTGGVHGLAVHECGDISGGCSSVGDHFNPYDLPHGSPNSSKRHVGDLGNIVADATGRSQFKFADRLIKVNDIIGRSIAVSEKGDDLGESNHPLSKVNGNCGKILSCGIIARSSGLFQNSKRICACDGVTIWDEKDTPLVGVERSKYI